MTRGQAVAVGVLVALAFVPASAQGPTHLESPEEFEAKLGYQTGTITLSGGMATLRLPPSFRFLGPEGSRRLLTEGWGNPPGAAASVLGMLIPSDVSPLTREGWGIVITYDEDGYVNDNDAASINYAKLLKELQEATVAVNRKRQKEGFEPVTLVGWAEPPSYDAAAHKLYWARELAFGADPSHTLNYAIRILGRKGVVVLNAVAGMNQLATIRSQSRAVLDAVEFNEGHRYADYRPGTDRAASYGLTGLIVGVAAAKTGVFKLLWVGLLAFKKVILVGVVALIAAIKRLLGGRVRAGSSEAV